MEKRTMRLTVAVLDALHSLWLSFTAVRQQQLNNAVRDWRPTGVAASQDRSDKKHPIISLLLNADYCPGYSDQFGKWNTGFPCPWLDASTPGFCCGTEFYKYCCSGKLRIATAPPPPPEDPLLLVLAITLGVAAGITLLILVACFVCPGCLLHKKRRPGPLYRLPCSSTMSTYVPAAMTTSALSPGSSNQQHQHQHRPSAVGFNDVRQSSSFQSFNGGGVGEGNGGIASLYSLSDAHCPTSAMVSAEANGLGNAMANGDRLAAAAHRQDINRSCHHLYWSRPLPRMPSVIGGNNPGDSGSSSSQQQHLIPVRMSANNNQGHLQVYRHLDDPSPPPPYEADFNPIHRQYSEVTNNRASSMNHRAQLRQHLQQLQQQQHQADSVVFRQQQQQQQSSNISPRQPALCIIDDGRRDNPQLTYHSTKF